MYAFKRTEIRKTEKKRQKSDFITAKFSQKLA